MSLYKKYKIIKKVRENEAVVSLYLSPVEKTPLEPYMPGQHLMLKIGVPGEEVNHFRFYSFSDTYNKQYYRISIKKEPAREPGLAPGKCSNYLYEKTREGDVLEAKGPLGDFCLDPAEDSPVVLIAGGIGITPLLSMAKSIIQENLERKVYFFYGVTGAMDHSFKDELKLLRAKNENFRILTFYTQCGPDDKPGEDFDHEGFIAIDRIVEALPDLHLDYYICGPSAMMDYVSLKLEEKGVSKDRLHFESFTSKTSENEASEKEGAVIPTAKENGAISIEFLNSQRTLPWNNKYGSILELAEDNGVDIPSGCLFGDCGTCLTKITKGEVQYNHPTLVQPGEGECLPCSSVPTKNISLEA